MKAITIVHQKCGAVRGENFPAPNAHEGAVLTEERKLQ